MARRNGMWLSQGGLHLLVAAGLAAQEPTRPDTMLDRLVQEAMAQAPALQADELAAEAAERRVRAAGARPDPMLTLGIMNLTLPRLGFRESDFTEVDIELSQELPWPGTLRARSRAAAADSRERRAAAAVTRRDLTTRVAALYYRLRYLATARLTLAKQRRLVEAGAAVALARYGAGRELQSDPLQSRVARARLDAQGLAFDAEGEELLAELAALRGRVSPEGLAVQPLTISGASPPLPHPSTPDSLALARHPRVAAKAATVDAREQEAKSERLQGRPDFAVMARYGARPLGADFASVAVGVRLPLWAGRKQLASAGAADREADAARASLARERARLGAELVTLRAKVAAGERRLALLTDRIVPAVQATAESSLRGYQVGSIPFASLLAAQDDVYAAELEAAEVAAEHLTHLVMLDQLVRPEERS